MFMSTRRNNPKNALIGRSAEIVKHSLTTIKETYGPAYIALFPISKTDERVHHMPTTHGSTEMYFATHNGNFDSGGRWYGGWINASRKHLTIDGERVVEVDLNASLLTLLSCVVSQPMLYWDDAYAVVAERLEFDEPFSRAR